MMSKATTCYVLATQSIKEGEERRSKNRSNASAPSCRMVISYISNRISKPREECSENKNVEIFSIPDFFPERVKKLTSALRITYL